ncbi:MAG: hypothetical protein QOE60_299, partial [Thermoleophilaceae bacterium]|nr:hypothetical protein [Thermoleophilaceae bacterium]
MPYDRPPLSKQVLATGGGEVDCTLGVDSAQAEWRGG